MSLLSTKVIVFDPTVKDCICGGSPKHSASIGNLGVGFAVVKCSKCGLSMEEESHNIGYGDSLKSIYIKVIDRWNRVMEKLNN